MVMPIKRNFSIAIFDSEKIDETNNIISGYGEITMQPSSHLLFDMQPVNPDEIHHDLTFFRMEEENETIINEKLNDLINDWICCAGTTA